MNMIYFSPGDYKGDNGDNDNKQNNNNINKDNDLSQHS